MGTPMPTDTEYPVCTFGSALNRQHRVCLGWHEKPPSYGDETGCSLAASASSLPRKTLPDPAGKQEDGIWTLPPSPQ